MNFKPLKIEGAFIIELNHFKDYRGEFIKTFHHDDFKDFGIPSLHFTESYFSISQKDVIRGMHFQKIPHEHHKLVYLTCGSATDVILDLRKESATYGQYETIHLDATQPKAVFIPIGLAHGFKALENNTAMTYLLTSVYNPNADGGVAYNSFGYDWSCENPIISERDKKFPDLKDFETCF